MKTVRMYQQIVEFLMMKEADNTQVKLQFESPSP